MGNIVLKVWRGEAQWLRAVLFLPLRFLSWIYGICLVVRESLFGAGLLKVEKAAIPVISVGNITVGGTGKTPVVALLSERLKDKGFRPGIVTLGYKRKREGVFAVNAKTDDPASVGDEALMLARRTGIPVIVGKKRIEAVELGIRDYQIDLALLDDAYQVRDIKKDLEILVLNGRESQRKGELLPLGPFREPLDRIGKADVILINKGELDEAAKMRAAGIPSFHVRYRPTFLYNVKRNLIGPVAYLKGKKVIAFAGLGDNRSFFDLLKELGVSQIQEIEFPDHHEYSARNMERLRSSGNGGILVTTEKDAIKLHRLEIPDNLFYLAVETVIEREEELIGLIVKRLGRRDVGKSPHI